MLRISVRNFTSQMRFLFTTLEYPSQVCVQGGFISRFRGYLDQPITLGPALLYKRHVRQFESSRQEIPCSALPQQGKSS